MEVCRLLVEVLETRPEIERSGEILEDLRTVTSDLFTDRRDTSWRTYLEDNTGGTHPCRPKFETALSFSHTRFIALHGNK